MATYAYHKVQTQKAKKTPGESYKAQGTPPPPGEGGRFRALKGALKKKKARKPGALAAWIGRRKYGKARFQEMAAGGK